VLYYPSYFLTTMKLFSRAFIRWLRSFTKELITHPITLLVALPLVIAYFVALNIEGSHQPFLRSVRFVVEFMVWWVGLGVLSSVGLGTGMHSGILFLFPLIMKVSMAASECKSLNFDSESEMWFQPGDFECPEGQPQTSNVTFLRVWLKVFLSCLLWGAGTAIGEIPPYAVTRARRLAGKAAEEFDDEIVIPSTEGPAPPWYTISGMQRWMITFIEKHGFWGVVAFSAWPNMAFDLCGMCCGHFLMPFWTFFGATFVGKAIIKVNIQSWFFIVLFSQHWADSIVQWIQNVTPAWLKLHQYVGNAMHEARESFHKHQHSQTDEISWGSWAWRIFMTVLIGGFIISSINQFAQQEQARRDRETIEKLTKTK